MFFIEKGIDAV